MRAIVHHLSGRFGYAAAAVLVLAYLVVALEPFRWKPPRRILNGAHRTETGSLSIASPGLVAARSAPPWADPAICLGVLKIHLRIRSFSNAGPIFSYADWNGGRHNLMIRQRGEDLILDVRTGATPAGSQRRYVAPALFRSSEWRDVEWDLAGGATLWVDGHKLQSDTLPDQAFSNWDTKGCQVMLANVVNGNRPWLGEIATCIVEAGDARVDYLDPEETRIPPEILLHFHFNSRPSLKLNWDSIANFVCFIPLGFILASLRGERGSFVMAALSCAALSCCVELAQLAFDRWCDVNDWLGNSAGGAVGALAARLCFTAWREDPFTRPGKY